MTKDKKIIEEKIGNLIRDVTRVGFMPKSEAKRRIKEVLSLQKQDFKRVVEGMPWVRGIDPTHPRDGSRKKQVLLIDKEAILKVIEE